MRDMQAFSSRLGQMLENRAAELAMMKGSAEQKFKAVMNIPNDVLHEAKRIVEFHAVSGYGIHIGHATQKPDDYSMKQEVTFSRPGNETTVTFNMSATQQYLEVSGLGEAVGEIHRANASEGRIIANTPDVVRIPGDQISTKLPDAIGVFILDYFSSKHLGNAS